MVGNKKITTKGRLQKKKVTNLGHCPNRGGGGPTPQIECPNLLKCFDTKIELNWSVSPNSTKLKKTVYKISLKDVPSSEGGKGVAEPGTISQVCAFFLKPSPILLCSFQRHFN